MGGSREDQYSIGVLVGLPSEPLRDLGVWDKQSGGSVDSEEAKFRRGGMGGQVSLGGSENLENVTVQRLYDHEEVHSLYKWLRARVGKATMRVIKQPLDIEGNAIGDPLTYEGPLKTVTPPDADSESNDAALMTLEQSTDKAN